MDFRTELNIKPSPIQIGLKDPILTIGSCFAETIGTKFFENKFPISTNPFGTSYHPLAIHKLINYAVFQEYPPEHTYLVNQETHLNYDFHSSFHAPSQQVAKEKIHNTIASVHYFLKQCKVLMITYGTAWLYEREDTGEAVANCHKMPGKLFSKRLSKPDELRDSFNQVLKNLRSVNPDIRLILTVSPVRHVKDTLPLNAVSKSLLRLACHEFAEATAGVEYFPAYEIMLDDLRDYRFYKQDMIHPTEVAEQYIWTAFSNAFFDTKTKHLLEQWNEVMQRIRHSPFNAGSSHHKDFIKTTIKKLRDLGSSFPIDSYISELESKFESKL